MTGLSRVLSSVIFFSSLLLLLFSLSLPVYAFVPNMIERAIHLGLVIPIVFLTGSDKKSKGRLILDLLIAATGVSLCLYIIVDFRDVLEQYGIPKNVLQTIMGILMVAIVMEAARRMIRPVLPLISLIFLMYALFGHLIPGYFGHVKYEISQIFGLLYLTTGGIWGQLTGISANIIAIFVILGSFIGSSGGATGFKTISLRFAGHLKGGPAKVATVGSAMMGTISGSASANVVATGAFTIPMMKRLGFRPALAAAVEAVASTGGQIMPPIMGAAAFIMAELIETPYYKIAISAILPAILYYYACWIGIHLFATKEGLRGLERKDLPSWRETLRSSLFFLIPFSVLIFMLSRMYTPQFSAFFAVLSTLPLMFVTSDWRFDPNFLSKFRKAIEDSGPQIAMIASICACAQIIIAVLSHTGLGVKISSFIVELSGGSLFLALLLTMATCIILGMEVPTTAAYIMAAIVAAPVLVKLGLNPLAAHMFVFYYAILSAITPPVCGAVYIASGIAGADWIETAKYSLRLSYAAFFLPFIFVYDNSLLLLGGSPLKTILCILRTAMSVTLLSASFIGYLRGELNLIGRLIFFSLGILWIAPGLTLDLLALFGTIVVFLLRKSFIKE